jgi:hypothetical protein
VVSEDAGRTTGETVGRGGGRGAGRGGECHSGRRCPEKGGMDNGRGVIFRVNRDAVAADGGEEVTPRVFVEDAPGVTQCIGAGELDFEPPQAEEVDDRPRAGTGASR